MELSRRCGLGLALMMLAGAAAQAQAQDGTQRGTLNITFEGLRSAKGMIRVCLTRDPAMFLHCDRDPAAFRASVVAEREAKLAFADVPPGDYVLAVVHDENGNEKVDTFLGIPREGVGFSRNPAMTFGPPKWKAASFHLTSGANAQDVKLKYFL